MKEAKKAVVITWGDLNDVIDGLELLTNTLTGYINNIPEQHKEASSNVINILEKNIEDNKTIMDAAKKDMDNNKLIGDIHKAINLNNSSEYLEHIFALEERALATSATIETILAKIGKRIEDGK